MENQLTYHSPAFELTDESYTEFVEWKSAIRKIFGEEGGFTFSFKVEFESGDIIFQKAQVHSDIVNKTIDLTIR